MLNFLIFSKDRACQLDMLLKSLKRHVLDFKCFHRPDYYTTTVLYKETEEYKAAYDKLRAAPEHNRVKFVKESNFRDDSLALLDIHKYTCLLTDDSLFFKDAEHIILPNDDETFSFRLGYNTMIQDHTSNTAQPVLKPDGMHEDFIFWNPAKYPNYCNFGYPYSFDGHIYTSARLLKNLKDVQYRSTNDMEGILNNCRSDIKKVTSFTHSRLVNIPCNNISGLTRAGVFHSYTMKELNDFFMSGASVMMKYGTPIIGCHQEVEFEVINGVQGL